MRQMGIWVSSSVTLSWYISPFSPINGIICLYMLAPQTRIILMRSAQLVTGIFFLVAAFGLSNHYDLLRVGISTGFVVLATLSFLMGYRWPGIAGVALAGMVYFTYWATNPYKKGIRFEDYVAGLFPEPGFVIQNRSRDVSKFMNRMVESDMHPDFVFRNQKTGKSFAVECKWRGKDKMVSGTFCMITYF